MANKYGEVALQAAGMETYGKAPTADERWNQAAKAVFGGSTAGQKRQAPRQAFAGLCEAGLVKGVPAVSERVPTKAGDYAVEAVRLLKAGTHRTVSELWAAVGDAGREHDREMDVVMALWKNGRIV